LSDETARHSGLRNIGFVAAAFLCRVPAFAGQDCECLGNGKRIKEGGVICLQIGSSQRYLARCERNLNNTSWKKISDGCPTEVSPVQMSPWPAA
jgi:N-acyl-L-homoserine lactone synthetase